ncbi:MAG: hypothetical protein AB7G34_10625 [Hyphomicrobiales bacterium]
MPTLCHAPVSRSFRMLRLPEKLGAGYEIGPGAPGPADPSPGRKVPALVRDDAFVTEFRHHHSLLDRCLP